MEIAEKRRTRYLKDPKHRDKLRRRAREWYYTHGKKPRRAPVKARARELWITARGERVRVYTIGQVALLVGLAKATLVAWEEQGVIPKPQYYTPARWRLYTEGQVELIVTSVAQCGKRRECIGEALAGRWGQVA